MPDSFFHGIELIEIDSGIRPITTIRTSVIGLLGTAPEADAEKFPLNTPVLLTHPRQIAGIGAEGTLPLALAGIHAQASPFIVLVRVVEGESAEATRANLIGGVDVGTGERTGASSFLDARDLLRVSPRLLIAPGFTDQKTVVDALLAQAVTLKAMVIADGPNTTDDAAVTYRGQFDSPRLYLVDPWVRVPTAQGEAEEPASARVAGLIARSDNERGFWWSPSNRIIQGITGASRPIVWNFNDRDTQANRLNEDHVTTIIHEEGYRLWGNRTCTSDARWQFFSVRRTADMINESLVHAHLWAVDRNITRTYVSDVTESVNAYLRRLTNVGAILGGRCWADPDLNSPENIAEGRVYFDFDFTPPFPAERIQFRSHMVHDYLTEVF